MGFVGKYLCDNYHQALEILDDAPMLTCAMDDLGMDGPHQFHEWLVEEMTYLDGLSKEPLEEVWKMDYLEKLLELKKAEYVFFALLWLN